MEAVKFRFKVRPDGRRSKYQLHVRFFLHASDESFSDYMINFIGLKQILRYQIGALGAVDVALHGGHELHFGVQKMLRYCYSH